MNVKSLNVQVCKGGQSAKYVEILAVTDEVGHRKGKPSVLRLTIVSDSYLEQCNAKIERWDGTQWHTLHYIPWPLMKTKHGLAYQHEEVNATHFMKDAATLTTVAVNILEKSESW